MKQLRRHSPGASSARSGRDMLRRRAHRIVFPAVEAGNAGLFRLASLLWRPSPAHLTPSGADRVLVLAPHPDDETLGCGGTIYRHLRAGDEVCIAIVTDGGNSRAGGFDRETMVALRRDEAEKAVATLAQGVGSGHIARTESAIQLEQFGLAEGEWNEEALIGRLTRLLEEFKPTVVYTTSRVDFHPEHLHVAAAFAHVLCDGAGKDIKWVRAYELQVPLTPVLANLISPIASTQKYKEHALAAYRTQVGSFLWVPRHNRYLRALYRVEEPIETFWEMTPAEFVALHAEGALARSTGFRSIRLRPFTDLASWAIGLRKRRALKWLVAARATL